MSKITGTEPDHWHDENGRHRMPDPRRLAAPQPTTGTHQMSSGASKRDVCHGDPDMAAYWDHLDAHDQETPERRPGDSAAVKALFDQVENGECAIKTARELISTLRRAGK